MLLCRLLIVCCVITVVCCVIPCVSGGKGGGEKAQFNSRSFLYWYADDGATCHSMSRYCLVYW